jgi:hypothetical protein
MKILEQKFTLPTSIVGNYPNLLLLWWDANFACMRVYTDRCIDQTKTLKRAFNSAAR